MERDPEGVGDCSERAVDLARRCREVEGPARGSERAGREEGWPEAGAEAGAPGWSFAGASVHCVDLGDARTSLLVQSDIALPYLLTQLFWYF